MINGFANLLFAYRMHSTLQIVRSEEHLRQTRSALKPLGFFGKLAYMGGLLFQVWADLWLLNVLLRWDFLQQHNETTNAFSRIRDILNDQFSDTATKGVSRRSMRRQLSHGFYCLLVIVPHSLRPKSQPTKMARRRRKSIEFQELSLARLSTGISEVSRSYSELKWLMLRM